MRFSMAWLALAFASASLGLAARADAQLTIRLTSVPAGTPADAHIYVAGTFNQWNPSAGGWVLRAEPGGGYALTLPDSVRGPVEFKFALGSWDSVETSAGGAEVPNRAFTVPAAGAATYSGTVAAWRKGAASKRSTRTPSVTILSDSFAIPELGRTRRVWLYLPPGYATSTRRYRVLYMHDGQNLFDEATGFAGEWGIDETLDSLHALGDPGAIVVGVDNGGSHRMDEYDPWKNPDPKLGGGEGDEYVSWIVSTLKPYIDAHYRTRPGPRDTGIMGSSMGGLISLYAALEHPETFGRAGVFSCACWVAGDRFLAWARAKRPARPLPRLYFVSGAFETPEGQPARDQRLMVDSLVAAGFPRGTAIRALTPADGKHSEWFWRREFPAAYRWLFADPAPRKSGKQAARGHRARGG